MGKSIRGRLGQQAFDHRSQRFGDVRPQRSQVGHRLLAMGDQFVGVALAMAEGRPPGQQVVERAAQAVKVGGCGDMRRVLLLLRRHIVDGAQGAAAPRQIKAFMAVCSQPGQPKVEDLDDAVACQQEV